MSLPSLYKVDSQYTELVKSYEQFLIKNHWFCHVCMTEKCIDPHHIDSSGVGAKGFSLYLVPLCRTCHAELHQYGYEKFCKDKMMKPWWLHFRSMELLADYLCRFSNYVKQFYLAGRLDVSGLENG